MSIKLAVEIKGEQISILLPEKQGIIEIVRGNYLTKSENNLYLVFSKNELVEVETTANQGKPITTQLDQIVYIQPGWDLEIDYLKQYILAEAKANKLTFTKEMTEDITIPRSAVKTVKEYGELLATVLASFGLTITAAVTKKPAGKPRHRWTKEVAEIEFNLDFRGSKATVLWHKRNEMLIKSGATMMPEAPLNKDGSVGFAAKMGEKIRSEQSGKFKNFITTEDILLKSVNEVGLFLYFGGTNSRLELVDANGKTLNDWTVVS